MRTLSLGEGGERQTDRQRETETERRGVYAYVVVRRERVRDRQTERRTETERETETERNRDRQTEKQKQRETETERNRDRQTNRDNEEALMSIARAWLVVFRQNMFILNLRFVFYRSIHCTLEITFHQKIFPRALHLFLIPRTPGQGRSRA